MEVRHTKPDQAALATPLRRGLFCTRSLWAYRRLRVPQEVASLPDRDTA
jgi:hypothetical protein